MNFCKKRLYLIFAISASSIAICNTEAAAQLKMLSEIEMTGIDYGFYVSKRCSSVSLLMSNRMRAHDTALADELFNRYMTFVDQAFDYNVLIYEREKREISKSVSDEIMEDIGRFNTRYERSMEDSYLREGVQINELIKEDTLFCKSFFDYLAKK